MQHCANFGQLSFLKEAKNMHFQKCDMVAMFPFADVR